MAHNAGTERTLPEMPDTHVVSGAVYTDKAIFEDEKRQVFGRCWHLACHESELSTPYDYRTFDYIGTPLIAIRGGDGVVRTFMNVCSHRGAKIIQEPSGNAKRLTCFYHLWSYDDRGNCVDIPRPEAYESSGLKKDDCGLFEVRTETHLGLVFINLDDKAPPVADYIGAALDPFADSLGSGELEVFHYNRAVLHANWKAWQETNLDLYHEWMHVLLRRTQVGEGSMDTRVVKSFENGHTMGGGLKASYDKYKGMASRDPTMALPGLGPDDFFFVDLWPNAALLARGTAIRIDVVTPIDEKTMLVEWRGLGLKGDSADVRRTRMQHHNQYWGPFGRNVPEDAFAAEACELGFRHGAATRQLIAREEGGKGQDDGMLRAWYAEWARRMGRSPANPTNAVAPD
ncbi:MAG: aromatic ring-hydroxylating dioxygenase subunit alpha [Alphaproteobacteria bacterium]|nr:aromatic ring-hydroxylating dioxygenase subunit alpha [Alphaproteobacteria bacterium]